MKTKSLCKHLRRRGKGMGHTQGRGDKEKGDEKGHLNCKIYYTKLKGPSQVLLF